MKSAPIAGLVLAAGLFAAGCATTQVDRAYEGPARPASEVAALSVPYQVDLLTIDGKSAPGSSMFTTVDRRDVELLPGIHEIVARYNSPYDDHATFSDPEPVFLRFAAEAGARYDLRFELGRSARRATLWIEQDGKPLRDPGPAPARAAIPSADPETLKAIWQKASPADRAAFKAWLETND